MFDRQQQLQRCSLHGRNSPRHRCGFYDHDVATSHHDHHHDHDDDDDYDDYDDGPVA